MIIPTVSLTLNPVQLVATWNCPGCGADNEVFLFSEKEKQAEYEMKKIESVQCDTCAKRFDTE